MATNAKANAKVSTKTTKAAAVTAGPRGFRFGYVFIQSVIDGAGVAVKEANHAKLVAFANELGLKGITAKTDAVEAAKTMKQAAKKYLNEHFEVA